MFLTKSYLKQVKLLDMKISLMIDEISRLRLIITKITPTLTYDAGFGGSSQDKLGSTISKIIDLENELNDNIDSYIDIKTEILHAMQQLSDPEEYGCLYKRYFEFKTWDQIAEELHMTSRNACNVHGKALIDFQKILEKKG